MSIDIVTLDEGNFIDFINGPVPVLVDFWAAWCGPCKMISPVVDDIALAFSGSLGVGKLNVDECSGIAGSYEVMTIPTLILFRDGKELQRITGYHDKDELSTLIDKYVSI